jgi:hypothetical protein
MSFYDAIRRAGMTVPFPPFRPLTSPHQSTISIAPKYNIIAHKYNRLLISSCVGIELSSEQKNGGPRQDDHGRGRIQDFVRLPNHEVIEPTPERRE